MVTYQAQLPELKFRCLLCLSKGLTHPRPVRSGGRAVELSDTVLCVISMFVGGVQTLGVSPLVRCKLQCRMLSNSCVGTVRDQRFEQICND